MHCLIVKVQPECWLHNDHDDDGDDADNDDDDDDDVDDDGDDGGDYLWKGIWQIWGVPYLSDFFLL